MGESSTPLIAPPHSGWKDHLPVAPSLAKTAAGMKLFQDPETGLMYSNHANSSFTLATKIKFLELAEKMWPNLSAICKAAGITHSTFQIHRAADKVFAHRLEEIKQARVDGIEGKLFEFGQEKGNFMDRIAVLRAYRGELYNPKTTVTYERKLSEDAALGRRANLATVIDAELVETTGKILADETVQEPVPGPGQPTEVQSPSSVEPRGNSTSGGGEFNGSGSRDPLLGLIED